jgi:hypothetical protein
VSKENEPAKATPTVAPIAGGKASAAQVRYIERLVDETGSDLGKVLDYFGVPALTELTTQAASRAIKSLGKTRRAA